jgi:DNA end-binding protein Ku
VEGFLKISLVNIPIKVFPASESAGSISFHQLHAECQTRIQQKRWCPQCEREVPHSEIVKGYEFEKGRYVVLGDEDFNKVRPESTRVIDLVQFADESTIDPMYVDRTYYLAPDGGMASDAFAVMREGMKGKVGVGKLALYGRGYLLAVSPYQRGIIMHTLHHAAEMRGIDAVEELSSVPSKVKPEEIKLAKQVIGTFEGPLNLADYKDEYREGLQRIIDKKIAGEEVVAPTLDARSCYESHGRPQEERGCGERRQETPSQSVPAGRGEAETRVGREIIFDEIDGLTKIPIGGIGPTHVVAGPGTGPSCGHDPSKALRAPQRVKALQTPPQYGIESLTVFPLPCLLIDKTRRVKDLQSSDRHTNCCCCSLPKKA